MRFCMESPTAHHVGKVRVGGFRHTAANSIHGQFQDSFQYRKINSGPAPFPFSAGALETEWHVETAAAGYHGGHVHWLRNRNFSDCKPVK